MGTRSCELGRKEVENGRQKPLTMSWRAPDCVCLAIPLGPPRNKDHPTLPGIPRVYVCLHGDMLGVPVGESWVDDPVTEPLPPHNTFERVPPAAEGMSGVMTGALPVGLGPKSEPSFPSHGRGCGY